jgi:glycosyltransferase involved in cell wall biosynthesis
LKIAVNTRLLIRNKLEGIGWFSYETLRRITQSHPEVDFYFFFDRKPDPTFLFGKNVTPVVVSPLARHPFLFVIWFEWSIMRILKRIKPDLFLSPDGYLSLSTNVPSLAVMHDLNFEHFPEDLPWLVRLYYRFFFPRFAQKAKRIATVSNFSKEDIITQYKVKPDKIDVVYNGANEMFMPLGKEIIAQTRQKFTGGHPYFLFVGSLHPRKNLARLFQAFDLFRSNNNSEIKLLVAGEKKWWTTTIRKAYEEMIHKDEIIFCGRLNSSDLHHVTASALAITYVSYFEGFGIPIIEAYRCGVPVITSNITSMPEVAGDAALLCDPYDIASIAAAMERMSSDCDLRTELIKKGLERAKVFTWDGAAERLWESILKAIKE